MISKLKIIFPLCRGFHPDHLANPDEIGRRLNFYKWKEQTLFQTIDLGDEGTTPLEVRFLHDPNEIHGYVGCALYSNLYHFWKKENSDEFEVEKVVDVPAKKVDGWALPELTGLIGDIIISLDDKYLYFSSWLMGDVRQYDITNRSKPKLTGQVFLGGVILSDSKVIVTEDKELTVLSLL